MTLGIARKVVRDALSISKDDVVGINTWQHTIDLSNELAIECFRVGADVLTVLNTDKVYFERHKVLPLSNFRVNERWVTEFLTAEILIQGPENPRGFVTVKEYSPEKMITLYERETASFYRSLEKRVRCAFVILGNLTPQRAKMLGFDYLAWKSMMDDASRVPHEYLARYGEKVRKVLAEGNEVHVTSKEGTNLTFRIGSYPVQVDDGVVSEEDVARGNLITHVPAGEVLVAVVKDSAEGSLIGEPFTRGRSGYRHYHFYAKPYSKLAQGLKLAFKNGRVTSLDGVEPVLTNIKKMLNVARGDKDRIGWLSVGINPRAEPGYFIDGMVQGSVTIGIGANKEIGGMNDSGLGFGVTMVAATVELDGNVIVENGKLKL